MRPTLVVAGNGMVGHKLVELMLRDGGLDRWRIVVFAEENRLAYDRVGLSALFSGSTAEDLSLVADGAYDGVLVHLADPAVSVDPDQQLVVSASGAQERYDALVLATGSYPFVPPVPGHDLPGCFVYRTVEDLERIREYADGARVGAVVGGGLLGLEAADALLALGLETHVVEVAPRLMPLQVDDGGAAALAERITELGVCIRVATQTTELLAGPGGGVGSMRFSEGPDLDVDLVVFSAGIRPRDELARSCGLTIGPRGGVVVDHACRTSDSRIFAIGECALARGRTWGLVGPGYEMAAVVASQLMGSPAEFTGADLSAKLKLMGVDVASFGDAFGEEQGSRAVVLRDDIARVYKRLVLNADTGRVTGGILVGDASAYQLLRLMAAGELPTPERPEQLLFPAPAGDAGSGVPAMADGTAVCSCNHVTKGAICASISHGASDLGAVKAATRAGTTCGGCVPLVSDLLREELRRSGREVRNDLCEHFGYSRRELFDIVRARRIGSFADLLARFGRGRGCEICKPAVASMLASLGGGHILDAEQAGIQDTNDHFLANLQRDGTYSVVPRVPGGELTPDQLITIGAVAKEFGLYTKITGGQRIDLFGARVEQLPAVWSRLIDAGMESGHAYGKALRTVKSCVGRTWCRYGVQDSTAMAIRLELRYRGLRAPHKIKSAVSGCARECAEAQSKDFGVIATERGWNLYVGGNGGMRPRHAELLASDLDDQTLVRYVDRFLMFYIRTADRLERTATWLDKLEGGISYLRSVVVDDVLGIGAELEAEMERQVAGYECEWRAVVENPDRLQLFRTFVNSPDPDLDIVKVSERGQLRPALPEERGRVTPVLVGSAR
jgi:nitrite reductase (NADH) large subunit